MSSINLHFGTVYASKLFLELYQEKSKPSEYKDTSIAHVSLKKIIDFLSLIDLYDLKTDTVTSSNLDFNLSITQNIVFQFALTQKPNWLSRFKHGLDLIKAMHDDEREAYRSLEYAGIFDDDLDTNTQDFFDRLSVLARMPSEKDLYENKLKLLKIGRRGEELSWYYEKKESNNLPEKGYLNNNDLGWDIKTELLDKLRFIEVKSSQLPLQEAVATLSRNQITTAKEVIEFGKHEYLFHFWLFQENVTSLAKLEAKKVLDELSKEKEWERLEEQKLYFRAFENHFEEVRV